MEQTTIAVDIATSVFRSRFRLDADRSNPSDAYPVTDC
jgi:hypothetical protein